MVHKGTLIQSLKITWISTRILDPTSNSQCKTIYLDRLNSFGIDLYFECDFHEQDIQMDFNENAFLQIFWKPGVNWTKYATV